MSPPYGKPHRAAGDVMLYEFIVLNRDAIIARVRERIVGRSWPSRSHPELENQVPVLLSRLSDTLRLTTTDPPFTSDAIGATATKRGGALLECGIHDYSDMCQVITEIAFEQNAPLTVEEFITLDRWLDEKIAGAVTDHARIRSEVDPALRNAATLVFNLDDQPPDRRRHEKVRIVGHGQAGMKTPIRPPPKVLLIANGADLDAQFHHLSAAGLEVFKANVDAAVDAAIRFRPDIIILDFGCNGEIMARLRSEPATCRIPMIALGELTN